MGKADLRYAKRIDMRQIGWNEGSIPHDDTGHLLYLCLLRMVVRITLDENIAYGDGKWEVGSGKPLRRCHRYIHCTPYCELIG